MVAQDLVTLMVSGGGGAALLALIQGLFKWFSGATSRERIRNTSLIAQRNQAVKERDEADDKRREAEEHVSMLKRQLREAGLVPVERPEED